MSLTTALALGRDIAALAVACLLVLTAAASLSGGAGLAGGLAATVAAVAASSLATLALFGAVAIFVEAPLGALLIVIGAAAVVGGFAAAQFYGVRGLWLVTLAVLGALLAALILWTFMRHLGRPIGGVAPLAAAAVLALTTFGALGATLRAQSASGAAAPLGAERPWRAATLLFATPPAWFDCAYATLGGEAVRPGFCAFKPPAPVIAAPGSPTPGAPAAPPTLAMAEPDRAGVAPISESEAAGPEAASTPAFPTERTPDFAPLRENEAVRPNQPDRLGPAPTETPLADGVEAASDAAGAAGLAAPDLGPTPSTAQSRQPVAEAPDPLDRPDAARVRVAAADRAPSPPRAEAPPVQSPGSDERRRTEFVCFPMPGGLADQLCPDDRVTPRDLSVRWLGAAASGGEARAGVDQIECFREPTMTLHATLVVDLNGAMAAGMPAGGAPARRRKIDAVYDMLTRLIVEARAEAASDASAADPGGRAGPGLSLSAYIAGGSRLESPWASQQFGEGRRDRVFDVRSTRQTLALVRRIQTEAQALRRSASGRDLSETLAAVVIERPDDPEPPTQGLVLAAVDASAARTLEPGALRALSERYRAARLPLYVAEIGDGEPYEPLRRAAEATGGGAFSAADAESVSKIADRLLKRTNAFCAVRISAPESFYDAGGVQVRLRRALLDGCDFEQIATISCNGLSMSERIISPQR
ncbi:MAG: hypothetical protein AAFW46_13045 [Pseudomonadota bacterium]